MTLSIYLLKVKNWRANNRNNWMSKKRLAVIFIQHSLPGLGFVLTALRTPGSSVAPELQLKYHLPALCSPVFIMFISICIAVRGWYTATAYNDCTSRFVTKQAQLFGFTACHENKWTEKILHNCDSSVNVPGRFFHGVSWSSAVDIYRMHRKIPYRQERMETHKKEVFILFFIHLFLVSNFTQNNPANAVWNSV